VHFSSLELKKETTRGGIEYKEKEGGGMNKLGLL
jgi:hypothetical protein